MVGAPARRQQVTFALKHGLSQRRACALLSTSRSTLHYESRLSVDGVVSVSNRSQGRYRRVAATLQRGPPPLKPGEDDPEVVCAHDREQPEPGGHPQELSGPKNPAGHTRVMHIEKCTCFHKRVHKCTKSHSTSFPTLVSSSLHIPVLGGAGLGSVTATYRRHTLLSDNILCCSIERKS